MFRQQGMLLLMRTGMGKTIIPKFYPTLILPAGDWVMAEDMAGDMAAESVPGMDLLMVPAEDMPVAAVTEEDTDEVAVLAVVRHRA
jgi:hypothetical protein